MPGPCVNRNRPSTLLATPVRIADPNGFVRWWTLVTLLHGKASVKLLVDLRKRPCDTGQKRLDPQKSI